MESQQQQQQQQQVHVVLHNIDLPCCISSYQQQLPAGTFIVLPMNDTLIHSQCIVLYSSRVVL
jgi:hypothetical protein